jgi:aquaporin Z
MHRKIRILRTYLSECIGTAALIGVGLSVVIFNNGEGSPLLHWIPSPGARRALTGFLFGTTGCLIALSPVGRISGAHINPVVSIAFFLKRRITLAHTVVLIVSQMSGAALGAIPLLLWGRQGASIHYGATLPLAGRTAAAFIGELITTFMLVSGIFFFVGHRHLRRFTPYLMPPLYCLMVWAEGRLSGTSTNPARSFGPAWIGGVWTDYWLYLLAPLAGSILAVLLFSMPPLWKWTITSHKLNQDAPGSLLPPHMNFFQ